MQWRREYFLMHGYSENCPGCQAALSGTSRQGHSEACRSRVASTLRSSAGGRVRFSPQQEKHNTKLTRKIEDEVERERERGRVMEETGQKR